MRSNLVTVWFGFNHHGAILVACATI